MQINLIDSLERACLVRTLVASELSHKMMTYQQLILSLLPAVQKARGLLSAGFPPTDSVVDVAVVGAGLAGLTAARDLQEAGKTVTVLEAEKQVGGRVKDYKLTNGGIIELGAAYVGATQDRVLALTHKLGADTFLEYNNGNNVLVANGERSVYDAQSSVPPLDESALEELGIVLSQMDNMASKIDLHAPWASSDASAWDSSTFGSWLADTTTTVAAKNFVTTAAEAIFSAEPMELSLLYVLAYIAAAGNETEPGRFERLISTSNGAQERRWVGGPGILTNGLANKIGSRNILTSAPVRSITARTSGGYEISSDHHAVIAKSVIVAMSPPLASRISYTPQLPVERDQLSKGLFMGALGKAIAVYEQPFWRDANLTGQAVSDSGTTRVTYDYSPSDGSYGAILGFLEADVMRTLDDKTEQNIKDLVTKDFVRYFGPRAANASEWILERWDNEPYSRGGPTALAGPGTLTKYGAALTKPFGNIHFAGTESSPYWTGYLDGAIRSGERAASEILGVAIPDLE